MQKHSVSTSSKIDRNSTNETLIRVLCVDDETSLLESTKSILELQTSFQVEIATSVDEALQKMAENEFDVIVSDYQMPIKSGLDFLKELREKGNNVPFILFTGKGREEVAVKALNLGADRYFNKIGHPETVYGELAHGIDQLANKKRVEKQLKWLSSVIKQSSNAIVILDKNEKISYVNPAFLQFHGFRYEDMIGTSWEPLIADGTPLKNNAQEIRNTVFNEKAVWSKEIFNTLNGKKYWRNVKLFPLLDEKNNVTHIVYNGEDITEQKRIEQAIWDREERLRAIIASSPDAMIITDLHGKIVDCNIETLKLLDVQSRKELIGEDCFKFFSKEELEKMKSLVPKLLEEGSINNIECKVLTKNGTKIDVEFSSNSLKDAFANPVGAVILAKDISERKEAQVILQQSEKKFRNFFDNTPVYCYMVSTEGKILEINKTALEALGYDKNELLGKPLVSTIYSPSSQKKAKKLVEKWKKGETIKGEELEIITKQGNKRRVVLDVHSVKGVHDEIVHSVSVQRDITDEKKAEEVLAKERDTIEKVTSNLQAKIVMVSKDYRILWANKYLKDDLGEVTGKVCYKALNRRDSVCPGCKVAEVIKTGKRAFHEQLIKHPTQGEYLLNINSIPIKDKNGKVNEVLELAIDITERKKVEDVLARERDTLEKVTGNLNTALLVISKDLHICWVNKYLKNILGNITGKICHLALNQLEHICPGCKIKEVIKTGKEETFEVVVPRSKNPNYTEDQDLFLEITAIPIKDKNGNVTEVLELAIDITERKMMETAIREAEEQHKVLIDSAKVLINSLDSEGKFVYVNKEWRKVFGYSEEEIKKLTLLDTVRSDYREQSKKGLELVLSGRALKDIEVVFVTKTGKEIYVRGNASPIFSKGKVTSTIAVFLDITEHKKSEEALKQSEKRFRELSEMLPEVIFETDCRGKLSFVNHAAYTKFGHSTEEFKKSMTASQFIVPQDRERAQRNLAKLQMGEETGPNEYVALRKDGTTFPVTIKSAPIFHKGKTVGMRGIMVDLTEHMKTQERLEKTLTNLETLNEKLRVVGKLSRHDVKNKLSTILNNAFLIRNQVKENQTTQKQLSDIELAVDQIEKILDFTRVYEMLGTQELTAVNVKNSLDEAFMLASQSSEVELVNECENLTVKADSLLRQIFYNLIENSIKHGETVTKIKVNYEETKNGLKLIYSDDGIGIPPNQKERIFAEGYGKGTGYGLYLIRKICNEYGWTISEIGKPGKGVQFVINIPE